MSIKIHVKHKQEENGTMGLIKGIRKVGPTEPTERVGE